MRLIILILIAMFLVAPIAKAEVNPLFSSQNDFKDVVVERVLTPDTIEISGEKRIKLIGLSGPRAPRRLDPERDEHGFIVPLAVDAATPAEEQAFLFVRGLLEGKKVTLEFDAQRRDEDNTLLAYVFLADGTNINVEIIRNGAARLRITPPNVRYAQALRNAYKESRREMRGLQGQW